jgi:hypothetical protein
LDFATGMSHKQNHPESLANSAAAGGTAGTMV